DDVALSDYFHADHSLAFGTHLLEERAGRLYVGIHVRSARIPPDLVDLDPVAGFSRTQRTEIVTGYSVGPYLPALPRLLQHVHHTAEARGPVGCSDAMHDQRIYIVCAQLAKKAVDVLPGSVRVAIVGLGLDNVPVARNALYGFAEIRIRAVLIC